MTYKSSNDSSCMYNPAFFQLIFSLPLANSFFPLMLAEIVLHALRLIMMVSGVHFVMLIHSWVL